MINIFIYTTINKIAWQTLINKLRISTCIKSALPEFITLPSTCFTNSNSTQVDHSCFSLYKGGPTDHFILDKSPSRPELREEFKRSRGNSQLSQFGSSILQLKDTDIYNNQKSQLDIINMQPVWHN